MPDEINEELDTKEMTEEEVRQVAGGRPPGLGDLDLSDGETASSATSRKTEGNSGLDTVQVNGAN